MRIAEAEEMLPPTQGGELDAQVVEVGAGDRQVNTRPDVGIIDIGLPRRDGYQVAKRIRDDPHGRGMLLLAVTGEGTLGAGMWPLEQGFDRHLVKPVDPDQLIGLLSNMAQIFQQPSL